MCFLSRGHISTEKYQVSHKIFQQMLKIYRNFAFIFQIIKF
jgi:hypothetical protein